ncbi:MAG: hypothetical protein V3W34_13200 [Phycisphaerae bacterium]
MAKISKKKLQEVLKRRLKLKAPVFELEVQPGGKVSGSVISNSFERMKDSDRQRKIWHALDAEFGSDSVHYVGILLAYTDAEWNVELQEQ